MAAELAYLSASEQLDRFRTGLLSPVEVLAAQIARVETANPTVNAITYEHFDEATAAAQESEERYRRGGALPLDGITVGMKDEHGLAGWTVTQGSRLREHATLSENDPIADKLLAAGAIFPFQTTVPELYLAPHTWSELWGVTRNPWNTAYSSGGSSGGSGVALAAGMCTLATGSDMGGSIRIPAALNGLYGVKPPYGRVPSPDVSLRIATSGPMARTLEDAILMLNAISGPHPRSPTTIRPELELPLAHPSTAGLRVAFSPDLGWARIDSATRANTLDAVETLRSTGAEVDEVRLDLGWDGDELRSTFDEALLAGSYGAVLADVPDDAPLTPYARDLARRARSGGYGPREIRRLDELTRRTHRKLTDQVFGAGYDVLVVPTLATSHVAADHDHIHDPILVDGAPLGSFYEWVLTPIFNMLNWYPVVNAPTGLTDEGMPTGMQIVAGPYDDAAAMRAASGYANAAPALFRDGRLPRVPGAQTPS